MKARDGRTRTGAGPDGRPAAVALTPILSARYRQPTSSGSARRRPDAPGERLARGSRRRDLDDVEVLLRGPLPAPVFDRLLARCPSLRWVHSATAGVERVLTPQALERGLIITNARGVFSEPIAEYVLMMILAVAAGCRSCSSCSASAPGSRSRRARWPT